MSERARSWSEQSSDPKTQVRPGLRPGAEKLRPGAEQAPPWGGANSALGRSKLRPGAEKLRPGAEQNFGRKTQVRPGLRPGAEKLRPGAEQTPPWGGASSALGRRNSALGRSKLRPIKDLLSISLRKYTKPSFSRRASRAGVIYKGFPSYFLKEIRYTGQYSIKGNVV